MSETEKKLFSTRDLYLASTLVTLHFSLDSIDMQWEGLKQKPIGYFKFEESPSLLKARHEYNQGDLLVEPRLYMTNLQSLKSEVMNFTFDPNSEYNKKNVAK